jgi:hypothetical protein
MFKLPAKIMSDVDSFVKKSLEDSTLKALENARERALINYWRQEMKNDLRINNISKDNKSVSAQTDQAYAFETGFVGEVEVTPLLKQWGVDKKVPVPDKGKFSVNFQNKGKRYKFMFKSIPNKSEEKAILDSAFSQTIRGGTV